MDKFPILRRIPCLYRTGELSLSVILKSICHVVLLGICFQCQCLLGADLHVAPPASGGSDINPGILAAPFATIQRAADVAVAGDNIFIRTNTYCETVRPAASGTANARITYQNYPGEVVTVSGADVINPATWTQDAGNVYSFFTSTCNQALQVFVDGEMVTLAKWPNVTTKTNAYPSGTAPPVSISHPAKSVTTSFVSKTRDTAAKLTAGVVIDTTLPPKPAGSYDGAEIYFQPNNNAWSWIFTGLVIQVPANGTQITFTSRSESGKDFNQTTDDAASRYYLFNKKEFFDTPREWWHDRANGQLYLWAPASASATPYGPFAIGNGNGTHVGTVLRNNVLHLVTPPAAAGYQAITGGTAFSGAEIAANLAWDGVADSGSVAPPTVEIGSNLDAILERVTVTDVSNHDRRFGRVRITVP